MLFQIKFNISFKKKKNIEIEFSRSSYYSNWDLGFHTDGQTNGQTHTATYMHLSDDAYPCLLGPFRYSLAATQYIGPMWQLAVVSNQSLAVDIWIIREGFPIFQKKLYINLKWYKVGKNKLLVFKRTWCG